MSRKPIAIGLLICEQVIVEETTRNVTPVNCWSRRAYPGFPSEPETLVAFAFLTGGLGEMSLEVVVHSLDNWDVVRRLTHASRFDNVLQEYRCTFRIRHMTFPSAGDYQVSILADEEILAQRILKIREQLP